MYKVLYISERFGPFLSTWGSWAIPMPHNDGWIMPLGWEEELASRGIEFEEIEIEEENPLITS